MVPPIMNSAYFYVKEPLVFPVVFCLIGLISNLWEIRKMTLCDMHCKYFFLCCLLTLFMMLVFMQRFVFM